MLTHRVFALAAAPVAAPSSCLLLRLCSRLLVCLSPHLLPLLCALSSPWRACIAYGLRSVQVGESVQLGGEVVDDGAATAPKKRLPKGLAARLGKKGAEAANQVEA